MNNLFTMSLCQIIIQATLDAIRGDLVVRSLNNLYEILDLNFITINITEKKKKNTSSAQALKVPRY